VRKIPCVFQRFDEGRRNSLVVRVVTPGCEWVLDGEGRPTVKWDGTACMVRDGYLFKRYDRKPTKAAYRARKREWSPYFIEDLKPAPDGWEPCGEPDLVGGHWPGWVPVNILAGDRWHREAWDRVLWTLGRTPPSGTYELLGPKVQGNPYGFPHHVLLPHGMPCAGDVPRTFEGIKSFLEGFGHEGIVFHHEDGRMAKIRRRDFGFPWPR
jgi:hypothetical protein